MEKKLKEILYHADLAGTFCKENELFDEYDSEASAIFEKIRSDSTGNLTTREIVESTFVSYFGDWVLEDVYAVDELIDKVESIREFDLRLLELEDAIPTLNLSESDEKKIYKHIHAIWLTVEES